ncbi:PREDICTED: F-BAR domain only protein 2 isoform X4 [Rhagoletis zephyria]|uniref:F-BAR domain only protein 2 isoform X4 n=1 Tax=Rhagoletis zephyria TaxID=28612 RepID=UPI0008113F14|nr:PREDICTED: F-BAR domain only protein 2 isoform X4 [Rhagoletis zephyria]XP_017478890.1 PREDICTED: F-BAR domain only protein 2 isoform X4 [Rhagoletis zephyria]XP_017478891.1 PREDICTED: F-BAR domain only protein 2 isoform X4 [Rhagoletis zephyria]XP_017478892.1 PREDICTED: F-BAR domain only protein 2 isoform X4 [Rhagoletis zephyria]XP_017478893.1 PREDICTED: F-BAR domain only protein 2 isoform X4 [Rhagoletis zephyria]XP_017478894.1 PREDICTED: F-BAR domain only protein 2 isoform X4 [Rhagoletis zep
MTVDFNDYFWGEKNNGFDVLYHNMKFGWVASKELSEFFREKSNIEEQNSKLMAKLAHKASTGTLNSTFAPVWTILRTSAEKLSTLHLQMVQKLTELVKDVAKYADELHKKHKSVKEEESQTLECVQAMQASTAAVQKLRDVYASKVLELEKLRKDNASQKDIEKVETKLRKLQDEYKTLLDKHNPIKNDFERRMTQTCKRFQEIEEVHLRQMKEFLSTFLEMLQNNHDMVGQVHSDFKRQFNDMTVDKLLEQFVLNKYTGLEKPEVPELEIIPLSIQQQQSISATRLNQPGGTAAAASNSNSATSIQGAISRITSGSVSMDQRGSAGIEAGSLGSGGAAGGSGSGSNSILNADDTILGIQSSPRATSPILVSATTANAASSVAAITTTSSASTGPAGVSSSSTSTTTSTVRSNFLNWFSSSIPSSKQQANAATSSNAPTAETPAAAAASTTTANSSGGGNFGTDSNGSTHTGTAIIKYSLNSELQSLQDNNNQGSFMSSALTQLQSEQSATTTTTTFSTTASPPTHCTTENNTTTTNNTTTSSTSSSITMSGILRSRRDKAKTKKSKKKKDGEAADNIQEERLGSVDRANNSYDTEENNKMKAQNSSGSSAGGLGISSASAPGSVDSSGGGAGALGINVSGNSGSGIAGNGVTSNANTSSGATGNGTAGGAAGVKAYGANEVDEDGYSMQPPKEIAWEENHDKTGGFYSDSDSDSDNDKPERRIHVKIKPLNNGQAPMSASVDELRATVENISLSPTSVFSTFNQQHSNQQQQQSRIASRQQSPEISNASTPTATVHPYAPLQSPTLSMSNNSRYADLGDIFSELGEVSVSAPASATLSKSNSRQIPTPTSASSIAIPRPPSRRSEMVMAPTVAAARGRISPSPAMNRADSIGSLEFRTAIGGIGSSRGPSPLTIGISDTIPIAVAFHEIIHAYFRGSDESRCQVKISGDMMLSFPAGIVGLLANNPNPAKLGFRIKNVQSLENLIPNSKLVQIDRNQSSSFSTMLEFNMPALTALLRRQAEHNPNASYFNVDILKYQVRSKPGASSCPFQLVSYWKCEPTFTALKIDYKYNNHAMASGSPLLNVTLSVPVNGSVRNVQSKPHSAWLGESNRLVWNFTDISQNSQDGGVGTLRARLELNEGPSIPALLTTQFNCEGTTLSGIEFELQGSGYRLSLVKRRFVSGKYVCEGDGVRSGATPTPPSVGSSSPFSAKSN